jgi:hypothetical protein
MSVLVGNPGSKMLQYIRSEQFGIHGESNKLYDIILVSIESFKTLILTNFIDFRNSFQNLIRKMKNFMWIMKD